MNGVSPKREREEREADTNERRKVHKYERKCRELGSHQESPGVSERNAGHHAERKRAESTHGECMGR